MACLKRRQVLKGIGTATATIGISSKPVFGNVEEDEERVRRPYRTRASNPEEFEEPPYPTDFETTTDYYYISREKWGRVATSYDAAARIADIIVEVDDSGLIKSGVSTGETPEDKSIVVTYTIYENKYGRSTPVIDLEELKELLPSSVSGHAERDGMEETQKNIPIEIKSETIEPTCWSISCDNDGADAPYFDYQHDTAIPGGKSIHFEQQDGHSSCTSTCRAYDKNRGEYILLSAGHCTIDHEGGEDTSDAIGREVKQETPDGRETIGNVYDADYWDTDDGVYYATDIAYIEMEDGFNPATSLADEDNGYSNATFGHLTCEALQDLEDDNELLCKQGRTTARCSGTIDVINAYCEDGEPDWAEVQTTIPSQGGDSGAPIFYVDDNDDAVIAAINHGSNGDEGWGYLVEQATRDIQVP